MNCSRCGAYLAACPTCADFLRVAPLLGPSGKSQVGLKGACSQGHAFEHLCRGLNPNWQPPRARGGRRGKKAPSVPEKT